MRRPQINMKTPLHLNLKLKEDLPNLRNKVLFKEFKRGVELAKNQGLYIIHFSIQHNHIHLFAEAKNNKTLALGMRSIAGRFAKIIRKHASTLNTPSTKISAKGSVFKGRYFIHVLKTPNEVKNALEYILLNTSKHQKLIEYMDPFSSARYFKHWDKLLGRRFSSLIKNDADFFKQLHIRNNFEISRTEQDFLSQPQSWLSKTGWTKACHRT